MITQTELKAILNYDPLTGIFRWLKGQGSAAAGSIAGRVNKTGYRYICINRKNYRAHRLAWFYVKGVWPTKIDHENLLRDDNRWLNLREANSSQNEMNKPKTSRNTSGVKGVSFHKRSGKWIAQLTKDGEYHYLGLYETLELAEEVVRKKRQELHGEFTHHG